MGVGDKIGLQNAGYSGTPLAKKLGIKPGFYIKLVNAPDYYLSLFTDLPGGLNFENNIKTKKDLIHFFISEMAEYLAVLPGLKNQIKPNGTIWVSWPKKASGVISDVTENKVRDYAIQTGLVDIKVCAVDATWSALKLVIPVKYRNI